jgi:hypothetical protein
MYMSMPGIRVHVHVHVKVPVRVSTRVSVSVNVTVVFVPTTMSMTGSCPFPDLQMLPITCGDFIRRLPIPSDTL